MKKKPVARATSGLPALLIAAGGTGGHINPGISIAEAWLAEGGQVVFATLMKNLEYPDIIALARHEHTTIVAYDAPRLVKNPLHWPAFFRRFRSAYRLVKQASCDEQVRAVVGMGGYSSFPAVAFSLMHRLPLFLCEQNAAWGLVTRLGRFTARRIFLSFAPQGKFPERYVVSGNPLRGIFDRYKPPKAPAKAGRKQNILFVGGSQGARDINALYAAFAGLPGAAKFQCTVSTGDQQFAEIQASARKGDRVLRFIENMPEHLAAADFVVARCGSGTLFELLWARKPAFLVPYPHAAADHQRANALAVQHEMDCALFDHRPFNAAAAASALMEFILQPRSTAKLAQKTSAQSAIIRYIKEEIGAPP